MSGLDGHAVADAALARATRVPGWYGKLSMLGDFAQRRLPEDVVRRIDTWLATWIAASRRALGERWLDLYLTAPLLRFAWAPGVLGEVWWFGVLMPSCDSSGRYFPLLVAQARDRAPADRAAFDRLQAWFDHVAAAAAETLDETASVDAFETALANGPSSCASTSAATVDASTPAADKGRCPDSMAEQRRWSDALARPEPTLPLAGSSIWWRRAETGTDRVATVLQGLPDPEAMTALLLDRDGDR